MTTLRSLVTFTTVETGRLLDNLLLIFSIRSLALKVAERLHDVPEYALSCLAAQLREFVHFLDDAASHAGSGVAS